MAKFDKVKFVGDGLYRIPGVPMRDMTGEEWYALPPELREQAQTSDLYEGVHDAPEKPASRRRGRADETEGVPPIEAVEIVSEVPADSGEGGG